MPLALLRAEGAAVLAASALAYAHFGMSWWLFLLLFLAPDASMAAYAAGPRLGALGYNLAHTYLAPAMLGAVGLVALPILVPVALIWTAHIGFDRALGYGLKYPSAFADTHLSRRR